MNLNNLRDTFLEQLNDVSCSEKQLTEALPKMVESASDPKLQEAFQSHLDVTHRQLERVHTLLQSMNVNPGNKKCEAMEGLVKEGEEMAKKDGDPAACDAGLIAAAQKVEHYEIATYGSLRAWAKALGEDEAAQVLQEILDEEYHADNTLDKLAEGYLNKDAVS